MYGGLMLLTKQDSIYFPVSSNSDMRNINFAGFMNRANFSAVWNLAVSRR